MNDHALQDVARYPLFSLSNGIEVAEAVRDSGGVNAEVPKASIAHALNTSDSSGGFLQRLATARAFGLIEGRGRYRLTELARRYFFPTEEGDKQRAQLEMFGNPPVFSEIIKRFDGQKLPGTNLLANVAQRDCKVAESWKDRVVSNFTKTAQLVGALDANGFLRYRSARHTMTATPQNLPIPAPTPTPYPEPTPTPTPAPETPMSGRFRMTIPYGDDSVYLETPQRDKLDAELWEMLYAAVQMLKPKSS